MKEYRELMMVGYLWRMTIQGKGRYSIMKEDSFSLCGIGRGDTDKKAERI